MAYEPSVSPGVEQLKALTHPVRVRMLGMLRIDGPATATALARRLGLNSGATSYHLRQLAQHGFVVDDPERGTGRERWWRAAHRSTVVPETTTGETVDAYLQSVVAAYVDQLQRSVEERPRLPAAWREATTYDDRVIRLTPASAARLRDAVLAAMEGSETERDDPEAVPYVVQLNAYPMPGHT